MKAGFASQLSGWKFVTCVERVDITLREHDGAILFAHADLSGVAVVEEAAW